MYIYIVLVPEPQRNCGYIAIDLPRCQHHVHVHSMGCNISAVVKCVSRYWLVDRALTLTGYIGSHSESTSHACINTLWVHTQVIYTLLLSTAIAELCSKVDHKSSQVIGSFASQTHSAIVLE